MPKVRVKTLKTTDTPPFVLKNVNLKSYDEDINFLSTEETNTLFVHQKDKRSAKLFISDKQGRVLEVARPDFVEDAVVLDPEKQTFMDYLTDRRKSCGTFAVSGKIDVSRATATNPIAYEMVQVNGLCTYFKSGKYITLLLISGENVYSYLFEYQDRENKNNYGIAYLWNELTNSTGQKDNSSPQNATSNVVFEEYMGLFDFCNGKILDVSSAGSFIGLDFGQITTNEFTCKLLIPSGVTISLFPAQFLYQGDTYLYFQNNFILEITIFNGSLFINYTRN